MKKGTTLVAVLQMVAVAWALAVIPLALTLLIVAVTWPGRWFAIASLLAGALPAVGMAAMLRAHRGWRIVCALFGSALGVIGVTLAIRAPDGHALATVRVTHVYEGASHFRRFSPGNVLSEVDQLMLAFTLAPLLDARLTQIQATALKSWTAAIYDELERDPDFRALGSVLPDAVDDFIGLSIEHGHAFVYVPAGVDRAQPRPALIFLHGAGGNFKAYTWLLARVADRLHMIVIAPSNGFGRWHDVDASRIVASALAAAGRVAAIDPDHVHVMGLSNGGVGVCQFTGDRRFRTLVFLSPVFDHERLSASAPGRRFDAQPMLVLSGGADDRIPPAYVGENIALLQQAGAPVTAEFVKGADHFMIFSHREHVLAALEAWLARNGGVVSVRAPD